MLRSWVVIPTGVPSVAVDPVIVTDIPVEAWFAATPPLTTVDKVVPIASDPAGLETSNEKVPEPGLLLASPEYEAVITTVRLEDAARTGAKVAEHAPDESVHVAVEGVNAPVELLVVKVTSPEGDEPVTMTAHVVNLPTFSEEGEHVTEVGVEAIATTFNDRLVQ